MQLYLSFFIFGLLLSVVSVYYFLTKKSLLDRGKVIQKISAEIIKSVTQSINSIKDIKLFKAEKFFHSRFKEKVKKIEDQVLKNNFITALPRLFLEVAIVSTILLICTFFVYLGRDTDQIIPYVSLFVVCSVRMIPAFSLISNALSSIRFLAPNFNYLYEEQVRGEDSFDDGQLIGIKDPLIGFHRYQNKGEINLFSLGFGYSHAISFNDGFVSIGCSINRVLKSKIEDIITIDEYPNSLYFTNYTNLSNVKEVQNTANTPYDTYETFSVEIPFPYSKKSSFIFSVELFSPKFR